MQARRLKVSTTIAALALSLLALPEARAEERQAAYVEVLGKGGLWGVGWDALLSRRLGGGVAGSFFVLDGERTLSISPYVAAYPALRGHHRWFVHAGPQLVRTWVPPVFEYPGHADTGLGVEACTGYEYRNHFLARVFVMGVGGQGGVVPWVGASFGWAF